MAKKVVTTTEYIDDLDGGAAADTVQFSYKGTDYEIDLSKKNITVMDKALKPYLEGARKVRATRSRAKSAAPSSRRRDLAGVRVWARENGFEISGRGRIPAEVLEKYEAAH